MGENVIEERRQYCKLCKEGSQNEMARIWWVLGTGVTIALFVAGLTATFVLAGQDKEVSTAAQVSGIATDVAAIKKQVGDLIYVISGNDKNALISRMTRIETQIESNMKKKDDDDG